MKKLFLLLTASSIIVSAGAQERRASMVFNGTNVVARKNAQPANKQVAPGNPTAARLTTTGGGRWYDYVDSVLALNTNAVASVGATELNLWNDTTAVVGFSGGTYDINTWTSVGMSLNPFFPSFNDSTVFPHEILVTTSNAYVVDSVAVFGSYMRPANPGSYTDQMRISLVYGNGTGTSDLPEYYFGDGGDQSQFPYVPYGVDTLNFIDMLHDSLNNQAGVTTAPGSIQSYTFNLTATDTATNFAHIYPVHLAVPAGNLASVSVGFKSGDPSYVAFDTVQYDDGTFKHGDFLPEITFAADLSGNPAWAPYDVTDQNVGFFKREGSGDAGWGGNYLPIWAWSNATTGGASALQYPYIWFHVTCATCAYTSGNTTAVPQVKNVTSIKAYPNPATNELNVSYNLAQNADVTVSLTNVLGQVVDTKTANNANNGVVTFNTTVLPAGMYIYTLEVNGQRATGHVVVAH